jgi:hypothetical protein
MKINTFCFTARYDVACPNKEEIIRIKIGEKISKIFEPLNNGDTVTMKIFYDSENAKSRFADFVFTRTKKNIDLCEHGTEVGFHFQISSIMIDGLTSVAKIEFAPDWWKKVIVMIERRLSLNFV